MMHFCPARLSISTVEVCPQGSSSPQSRAAATAPSRATALTPPSLGCTPPSPSPSATRGGGDHAYWLQEGACASGLANRHAVALAWTRPGNWLELVTGEFC